MYFCVAVPYHRNSLHNQRAIGTDAPKALPIDEKNGFLRIVAKAEMALKLQDAQAILNTDLYSPKNIRFVRVVNKSSHSEDPMDVTRTNKLTETLSRKLYVRWIIQRHDS